MIEVVVVYCLTLNPTLCRTLTVAPVDHAATSVPECIKGGAIYEATTFRLEHAEWTVKGWHCHERENVVQTWLDRHREGD
jgi:hypothetical protein